MRIQKYLSEQGLASRREATALIKAGLVVVNGQVARETGQQIDPARDRVTVTRQPEKMTVTAHKPRGIVCSRESSEGQTVFDLWPQFKKLNILGRLDKASEGLILLSNDGVLARAVTGEEHTMEKEYEVEVQEEIRPAQLAPLEHGIKLADGPTLPAKVKFLDKHSFNLIIKEGRKHQIRRMAEKLHLTVVALKRLRIGNIALGKLKAGEYRLHV